MQYKLIEHPKEKGEWLVVSNEDIKEGEFVVNLSVDRIDAIYPSTGEKMSDRYKIIASSIFIDKSIPLMRKEQLKFGYTEDPIDQELDHIRDSVRNKHFDRGFASGYNKRAETHPWTDEDLRKAFLAGMEKTYYDYMNKVKDSFDADEFIESLKQPKEWIVEFEMEKITNSGLGYGEYAILDNENIVTEVHVKIQQDSYKVGQKTLMEDYEYSIRPKVDKEGYVNITSIKPI